MLLPAPAEQWKSWTTTPNNGSHHQHHGTRWRPREL